MNTNAQPDRSHATSEAEWNQDAAPVHSSGDSIVLIDVQSGSTLGLFETEDSGSSDGDADALDPLDLFAAEATAKPSGAVAEGRPIGGADDPVAAPVAEAAKVEPPAREAGHTSDWEAALPLRLPTHSPLNSPLNSPKPEPVAWFHPERIAGAALMGLLAGAAVAAIVILTRSFVLPALEPATMSALRTEANTPGATEKPATESSPAQAPAATGERSTPPTTPPRAEMRPPPAAERPAADGAMNSRGLAPPAQPRTGTPGPTASTSAPVPAATAGRSTTPSTSPRAEVRLPPAAERSTAIGAMTSRGAAPPAAPRTAPPPPTAPSSTANQASPSATPAAPREETPARNTPAIAAPQGPPIAAPPPESNAAASSVVSPTVAPPPFADAPPPSATAPATPSAAPTATPTVPPAATSSAATSIPSNRAADTEAIQTTLSRYRSAFSGLDASAAGAVWPTVDQKALGKAFERLERQSLRFENCTIDVRGVRALATCKGTADYVPKVGNKTSRSDNRQWTFNLRKIDERWLIDAVNSR